MIRRVSALALSLTFASAVEAQSVRFISCPIYRDADAGRKSGCWLSDDASSGTRYDVMKAALEDAQDLRDLRDALR